MTTKDTPMKALEEAISIVKGPTNLAVKIGRRQSTVSNWLARGRETPGWKVPADACPAIERETGVRCERLHPGEPWEVLRNQRIEVPRTARRTAPAAAAHKASTRPTARARADAKGRA